MNNLSAFTHKNTSKCNTQNQILLFIPEKLDFYPRMPADYFSMEYFWVDIKFWPNILTDFTHLLPATHEITKFLLAISIKTRVEKAIEETLIQSSMHFWPIKILDIRQRFCIYRKSHLTHTESYYMPIKMMSCYS